MKSGGEYNVTGEELVLEYLKNDDPGLREKIIVRFVPVVKYVIGRLNLSVRNKAELEDIHSAGITGLIRALDDFDPTKNTKFKTYATLRVRGFILDYLRKIDMVSRGDRTKIKAIEKTSSAMAIRLGREPSNFEIANELGLDLRECHRLLELTHLNFTISLERENEVDGETTRLAEAISDNDAVSPFEELSKKDILGLVKEAISQLPERQKLIVLMYYNDEMTLLEIGKVLSLSESRVSRLLGKAIISIRTELRSKQVQFHQI